MLYRSALLEITELRVHQIQSLTTVIEKRYSGSTVLLLVV